MAKIVLIPCVSKKQNKITKAKDLYTSPLFKYSLKYALSLTPDKIFILSAKYGLLDINKEVEPYNQTINKLPQKEIKNWANNVLKDLNTKTNLKNDEFIILAGENYRKYLLPYLSNYKIPLKGLGIGKQLQFLKVGTK